MEQGEGGKKVREEGERGERGREKGSREGEEKM